MNFRLNIATKIILGFGILTATYIVNAVLTNNTLNKSIEVNRQITEIYNPTEQGLAQMEELLKETKMLIKSWVFVDKKKDTPDKLRLREIHETTFPELDEKLLELSESILWEQEDKIKYMQISMAIKDSLFPLHQDIMSQLLDFSDYDDAMKMFLIIPSVDEEGDIIKMTEGLVARLDVLVEKYQAVSERERVEMDNTFSSFQKYILYASFILIGLAIIISFLTIRTLSRPINGVKDILLSMAKGKFPDKEIPEGTDEIGQMSAALNKLIKGLKDISNFALEVGKGNFNSSFKPLSDEDVLGNSLIDMRQELKNAADEEAKRKIEDANRNWATQGIARFAEILRKNNDNMEELSYNVISNLVKYMDANQGGLFLINNADERNEFIELIACYAYDRRKYIQKRIELKEGLVGRCVQEGETIYMSEIPTDYIHITSGLGDDNPRSLLLVPLILNEEIYGVIEIASFKLIQDYQVDFVEKIGESIASTLSPVKINLRTTLLLEQSQQQAEEMKAQEEEMRQNLEELRATQEQSSRREDELKKALNELQAQKNKRTEAS
jgi:hypothetical protein